MRNILFYFIITMNLLLAERNITIYDLESNKSEFTKIEYVEFNTSDRNINPNNLLNLNKIKDNVKEYQMNFYEFKDNGLSYNFFQLIIYTFFYLFIMLLFMFLFRYKVKNIYTENSLYCDDSKNKESLEDTPFDFPDIENKLIIKNTKNFIFNSKNFISIFIVSVFIIFYYLWYVFIYTYSIQEQYKYKIILEKKINTNIIDRQNKTNAYFVKKLTRDTKTLSLIVDSLQETRKIGNSNNSKFINLINKLNEQIKENNNEIKELEKIKPIQNGTIIQFGE